MNGPEKEYLKELFEKFVGTEQADEAVEDILRGEQILRDNPAPQPDKELIDSIKSQVTWSLLRRQEHIRRMRYEAVAAVAAAVILLATIWTGIFQRDGGKSKRMYAPMVPRAIWESDDIASDDPHLASLTAEVEQIENELLTLQEGETSGNGERAVSELEMELAVINSDLLL
jgi:hypothetical protein